MTKRRPLTPPMRAMLEAAEAGEPIFALSGGTANDVQRLGALARRAGADPFVWNREERRHDLSAAGRELLEADRALEDAR